MKTFLFFTMALLINLSAKAADNIPVNKFGNDIANLKAEFYTLQKEYMTEMEKTCSGDDYYVAYLRKYMSLQTAYYNFVDQKIAAAKQMKGLAAVDAFEIADEADKEMICEIEASHEITMTKLIENCDPSFKPYHKTATRLCF